MAASIVSPALPRFARKVQIWCRVTDLLNAFTAALAHVAGQLQGSASRTHDLAPAQGTHGAISELSLSGIRTPQVTSPEPPHPSPGRQSAATTRPAERSPHLLRVLGDGG